MKAQFCPVLGNKHRFKNSEAGTNLVALTLSTVLWSIDFLRSTTLGTEQVTQSLGTALLGKQAIIR